MVDVKKTRDIETRDKELVILKPVIKKFVRSTNLRANCQTQHPSLVLCIVTL